MKTLKKRLEGDLKKVYYIYGEDIILYDRAINLIKKACNIAFEDFNLSIFDDDNFDSKTIISSCNALPISDEVKLVIVKNIPKINEQDKKEFLAYIKNPNETTCLVICDIFNIFGFIKEYSEEVICKRLDSISLQSLILREVTKYNKTISKEATLELIDKCNSYLGNILQEVKKLCFCTNKDLIDKELVSQVVAKDLEYTIFELTDALGRKNSNKAINLIHLMEKESGIISLIESHFRRLFYVSITNGTNLEIATALNVKEYAIVKAKEQAKNFSKIQLKKIMEIMEEADYMIKDGKMREQLALYYVIFNILKV